MVKLGSRGRATAVAVMVAVVVAGLVVALMAGGGGDSPTTSPTTLPTDPTALPKVDAVGFGAMLDAQKGRVVVMNLWASWCGPCIQEAPGLAQLSARYRGRVQFVGVDTQDRLGAARQFIARYGWTFPSVFDPDGSLERALGYIGQPVTVVYSADGSTSKVFAGPVEAATLDGAIQRALGGASEG